MEWQLRIYTIREGEFDEWADGFAAADARYYASEERRAVEPDPARHIEAAERTSLRDLAD